MAGAAKANARLNGRDYVTAEDVREIAPYVLHHRLICEQGTTPEKALAAALEQVPVPEVSQSLVYA
jgi:MoxR-like ATPase